ncbi:MAG: 2Fe-2S iron-sulfur cluster binding domain-containing protein [Flavobacteriales bacterium]|jgi:ferredoxin|nr:2Fe-2S iron-sulfur cluster binding domain-containing protein [Flavobacteriales bacterium]
MFEDNSVVFEITLAQTGEIFSCGQHENIIQGMLRHGKKGIPSGCVNGGCGICKIRLIKGDFSIIGPVSRAHVSIEDQKKGYTLACRVRPRSALVLQVEGRLKKPFQLGFTQIMSAKASNSDDKSE